MATTTNVKQVKLNIMTQSQYNSATKNANELYMLTDAKVDYNDLSNKPTIPTVNDATLTIQKNGTSVATFTANSSTNQTANITVPTDTGDLTNGAGFITGITSGDVTTALGYTPYNSTNPNGYQANVIETVKVNGTALTPSSKAVDITVPTVNNPTITITQGGVTKGSFTLNQSSGDTIELDAGGGGGSYTAGDGIDITSNVISNTGVRSVSTGTNNGTISVDTNGTSAEVSVAGLGSAAFKSMTSTYDSTGTDPVDGVAVASAISDKADTSLSNLQDGGIQKTVRTGMIIPYDGSTAPSGWLLCDGSNVSRTTYASLFAVIGTTYGAGDGSTTFNVPTKNDFPSGYPSNSYSSVTVGSTGTIYTADKNGWYSFSGQATANGQYILIRNGNSSSAPRFAQVQALNGQYIALSIPARKGDKVKIEYSIGSTSLRFFEDSGSDCIIKT